MIIESNVMLPESNEQRIAKILKLHNLSATTKYHANHLHDSGCYDKLDEFHTNKAYEIAIETVRYARIL